MAVFPILHFETEGIPARVSLHPNSAVFLLERLKEDATNVIYKGGVVCSLYFDKKHGGIRGWIGDATEFSLERDGGHYRLVLQNIHWTRTGLMQSDWQKKTIRTKPFTKQAITARFI